MQTTLPAIAVAYRGRRAMLRAIFGSGEDDPKRPGPPAKIPEITPEAFDAMFGRASGADGRPN